MTHPVPSRRASGLLCLGEFVVLDDREVAAVRHRVAERRLVAGEVQGALRSHVRFSLFCVSCCCSCYLLAALAAGMPPMPSVVPRDTSDSGALRTRDGKSVVSGKRGAVCVDIGGVRFIKKKKKKK